jgi:hypothetical protein
MIISVSTSVPCAAWMRSAGSYRCDLIEIDKLQVPRETSFIAIPRFLPPGSSRLMINGRLPMASARLRARFRIPAFLLFFFFFFSSVLGRTRTRRETRLDVCGDLSINIKSRGTYFQLNSRVSYRRLANRSSRRLLPNSLHLMMLLMAKVERRWLSRETYV